MILLPAIDLYEGKVVRLLRGDYAQMTVYSSDPVATARKIEADGAGWLHTVDLEGAKSGETPNFGVIAAICRETGLKVEIGGGIRDMKTVEKYFAAGVTRVILGTAAVRDPAFLDECVARFGRGIAVGVDAKDGRVAVSGWLDVTDIDAVDFILDLSGRGVGTVICTDISRDGAMKGTNLGLYKRLCGIGGPEIIASGGVSTCDDVVRLKEIGVDGAIIGRALYTGDIVLSEALGLAR